MRHLLLLGLGLLPGLGAAAPGAFNGNHMKYNDGIYLKTARSLSSGNGSAPACPSDPTTLHMSDPPYENYFYSDCNVATQVVITSPLPDSNLKIISPRLIVAWPAGNSGVCAYFEPQNGVNGTLGIELVNSTVGNPLAATYRAPPSGSKYPRVGVTGVLRFNSSAVLTLPILGSVRTIRDFTEGPSLLDPEIQDAITFTTTANGGASLQRLWLDNVTTTTLSFTPAARNASSVKVDGRTLKFDAGEYIFATDLNYPQLKQLKASEALNPASQDLIQQEPVQTSALSFLSYSNKLLAGAWRFLTYFGRDSMITALLMEPVLSHGEGSAMEAVIGAVLERLNRTDGRVCHEETIGDYATYLNKQENITSTDPVYDYKMVDSDYFLPVLMKKYFLENEVGRQRASTFLNIPAGDINPANSNLTYGQLALINAERVMRLAAPFAAKGNQTKENLIHLEEGQVVGQWRDSTYGLGGGRIPFDVNTALVPAALRSIAGLARQGFFPKRAHWAILADKYADVWEDKTLQFFEVTIPKDQAQQRVTTYAQTINFPGPNQASTIDSDVHFYSLALDGNNNLSKVEVMHTDDCFRHFLLNTTSNQPQLTSLLNQTANNVRRTFPAGLLTDVSLLVANPAYGPDPVYARNFTNSAYHGTVVWSWQLAMMAKGLEQQLGRCDAAETPVPEFCNDAVVHGNVKEAYNLLWDSIEANRAILTSEVWSWVYRDGGFQVTPLGALPPPPGVGGATESNIQQLWSLAFLAVTRNEAFR